MDPDFRMMDCNEIIQYFNLQQEDATTVTSCIKGYGQQDPVGQLFYRASEWIKSLFGQSDWQHACKILKSREKRKLIADIDNETPIGVPAVDQAFKKVIGLIAAKICQDILNHQICVRSNFSFFFSPISFNDWITKNCGTWHPQSMHDIAKWHLERTRGSIR